MKLRAPLLALAASLACAQADLVLVQKVDGAGQSGEQTIRIKGGKSRSDISQSLSIIADSATGDAVTLKHSDKSFMRIPAAQTRAMAEEMKKRRGSAAPPELKPAGKKEKIGEYECEIFTCDLGGLSVTYWFAKDYPNHAAIQEQLAALQSGGLGGGAAGVMPDPKTFPGMALKTEMDLRGKKVSVTILSVKEEAVDAAIFNVPGDYKELATPVLPAAPK